MQTLRWTCACLCSCAAMATLLPARATAEAVQTSFTVDPNTTALYLFKEGTGTTTAAEVGPAATLKGATWTVGRKYFAVATNTGYVEIADSPAVRPANAITLEIWVKINHSSGDLICKNGQTYLMRMGGTISAGFAVGTSGYQYVNGNLPVPTGQWTHLAMTYDSATSKAALYINGVLDNTATFSSGGTLRQGTTKIRLGQNDWSPMGSEVDCKIDSFRVSNIARVFQPIPATVPPPVTPPGNLVPNGDFEMGVEGWRNLAYGDVNLAWETTGGAYSGQKCLHSLTGASLSVGMVSRPIPVHPGGKYTLSMRMKYSTQSYPRIEVDSVTGEGITGFPWYPTVGTGWTLITRSFTLPSNFISPYVYIYFQYPSSGTQVWVDDIRLLANVTPNGLALKDKISVGPAGTMPVGNLYVADQTSPMTLNIVNTDTVAHSVIVQPTITDWENKLVSGVPSLGSFSVPPNGVKTATYNVNTTRRGAFRLGFDLTSERQTWHQLGEVKYAVAVNMQNVGNAETSVFAMNTHMEREPSDHLAREMQVLSKCGVKWIRAWWGWGMCEDPQGTYNYTEYDRQFNTVTTGTGLRIMPILLRYYYNYEKTWAGPVTASSNGIQEYPYANMVPVFGTFCGKVAQRYQGRITAYEIWNEPTMGNGPYGTQTSAQYAALLNAAGPAIRAGDPNAKIVAFAGTPLTGSGNASVQGVLALGTASQMDAISEHSYSQTILPEIDYPKEISIGSSCLKSIMQAGGAGSKAIWHTEQGIVGDDDGYSLPSISEVDIAQLYTRNLVTAVSQGSQKFFWFSVDDTLDYGFTIFYGSYNPRRG